MDILSINHSSARSIVSKATRKENLEEVEDRRRRELNCNYEGRSKSNMPLIKISWTPEQFELGQ